MRGAGRFPAPMAGIGPHSERSIVIARRPGRWNWSRTSRKLFGTLALGAALALPAAAAAHLERPSYWPDPAPDTSVSPPAGGEVPDARGLPSAVTGKGPGDVLVVCKGQDGSDSLRLLRKSLE